MNNAQDNGPDLDPKVVRALRELRRRDAAQVERRAPAMPAELLHRLVAETQRASAPPQRRKSPLDLLQPIVRLWLRSRLVPWAAATAAILLLGLWYFERRAPVEPMLIQVVMDLPENGDPAARELARQLFGGRLALEMDFSKHTARISTRLSGLCLLADLVETKRVPSHQLRWFELRNLAGSNSLLAIQSTGVGTLGLRPEVLASTANRRTNDFQTAHDAFDLPMQAEVPSVSPSLQTMRPVPIHLVIGQPVN